MRRTDDILIIMMKKHGRNYSKCQPIRNWEQALPATNDYQTHTVEIKIDELPVGEYILLAASDKFF